MSMELTLKGDFTGVTVIGAIEELMLKGMNQVAQAFQLVTKDGQTEVITGPDSKVLKDAVTGQDRVLREGERVEALVSAKGGADVVTMLDEQASDVEDDEDEDEADEVAANIGAIEGAVETAVDATTNN